MGFRLRTVLFNHPGGLHQCKCYAKMWLNKQGKGVWGEEFVPARRRKVLASSELTPSLLVTVKGLALLRFCSGSWGKISTSEHPHEAALCWVRTLVCESPFCLFQLEVAFQALRWCFASPPTWNMKVPGTDAGSFCMQSRYSAAEWQLLSADLGISDFPVIEEYLSEFQLVSQ